MSFLYRKFNARPKLYAALAAANSIHTSTSNMVFLFRFKAQEYNVFGREMMKKKKKEEEENKEES